MHDICNTANATAREIALLVEKEGRELYGKEAWESMPEEERCVLDFLCGNHTLGLPVDAFNHRFEGWIEKELGEAFETAAGKSGGQARLEKSGTELLRSIFKLIHAGWGAYEKVGLWVVSQSPCCSLSVVGHRCRMPRALIYVQPEIMRHVWRGRIGNMPHVRYARGFRSGLAVRPPTAATNTKHRHQSEV